jgi:hypothetical protein
MARLRRFSSFGMRDGVGVAEAAGGDAAALAEDLIEGERGGAERGLETDGVRGQDDGELRELEQLGDAADGAEQNDQAPANDDDGHQQAAGGIGLEGPAAGGEEYREKFGEEVGEDAAEGDERAAADGEEDLHAEGGPVDARRVVGCGRRHGSLPAEQGYARAETVGNDANGGCGSWRALSLVSSNL